MNEIWLRFDSPDDEEASHEANVAMTDTGFRVEWSHTAVGLVSGEDFGTLAEAYDFLESHGYRNFGA